MYCLNVGVIDVIFGSFSVMCRFFYIYVLYIVCTFCTLFLRFVHYLYVLYSICTMCTLLVRREVELDASKLEKYWSQIERDSQNRVLWRSVVDGLCSLVG